MPRSAAIEWFCLSYLIRITYFMESDLCGQKGGGYAFDARVWQSSGGNAAAGDTGPATPEAQWDCAAADGEYGKSPLAAVVRNAVGWCLDLHYSIKNVGFIQPHR
jgi:hypothetical protein